MHQWLYDWMDLLWFCSPTPAIRFSPRGVILLQQGMLWYPRERLMKRHDPLNHSCDIFSGGVSAFHNGPGRPSICRDPFPFFGWQGLGKAKPILREGVGKGGNPLDEFRRVVILQRGFFHAF